MSSQKITALALVAALSAISIVGVPSTSAAPATCEARKLSRNSMQSLCLHGTPGNGHYAEARLQFDGYAAYRHSDLAPMGEKSISGIFHGGYISEGPWPVVQR